MHGFRARNTRMPSDFAEHGEINVTPFIDVVLVLLIVFMIAAPLSTVSVPLELPAAEAVRESAPDKPVVVSVQPDLTLHINEAPVQRAALAEALRAAGASKDTRLLLRADKRIAYGDLMAVLDALRRAGYVKVALVGLETGG